VHYNWNGFGIPGEIWAIIMIAAGTLIVVLTIYRMINPFIGLSVIWAFTGIILKRHEDYRSIVITSVLAIIIVTIVTIYRFIKQPSPISS